MSDKPIVWLHSEVKTPPLSAQARFEAGVLLRALQQGKALGMPHSRPMPIVGARCHELRIPDTTTTWRIVYRLDRDAVVIADVFSKKTRVISNVVLDRCRRRLVAYDAAIHEEG